MIGPKAVFLTAASLALVSGMQKPDMKQWKADHAAVGSSRSQVALDANGISFDSASNDPVHNQMTMEMNEHGAIQGFHGTTGQEMSKNKAGVVCTTHGDCPTGSVCRNSNCLACIRGLAWCTDSTNRGGNCCNNFDCSLDYVRNLPDPQNTAPTRPACWYSGGGLSGTPDWTQVAASTGKRSCTTGADCAGEGGYVCEDSLCVEGDQVSGPSPPPPPPAPSQCGEDCATGSCESDICSRCKNSKYLSTGICVEECPPGFVQDGNGAVGRTCKICEGESRRRRASTQCDECQPGFISKTDTDECQNLQATCTLDQCLACATCVETLRPRLVTCLGSNIGVGDATANCYHHGLTWCPGLMEGLFRCQEMSLGCFYKILCHSPCLCDEWKATHCGGQTGGSSEECVSSLLQTNGTSQQHKMMMTRRDQTVSLEHIVQEAFTAASDGAPMSLSQMAKRGSNELDLSLAGKCA